jgi:hypothetical protein
MSSEAPRGVLRLRLFWVIASTAIAAALLAASSAGAGIVLGSPEWQNPGNDDYFPADTTLVQTKSLNERYAAPIDGVITSWGKWAGADPNNIWELKLKVARHKMTEPTGWQIVGESNLERFTALNVHNSFPTRVPVKSGDVIGVFAVGEQLLAWDLEAGYDAYIKSGAEVLSSSGEFLQPKPGWHVIVDAILEPDVDGDGFGDETQDQCTTATGPEGCPPPRASSPTPATSAKKAKKAKCKKGFKKVRKGKAKGKCRRIKSKPKPKGKGKGKGHG